MGRREHFHLSCLPDKVRIGNIIGRNVVINKPSMLGLT